jgi:hypothetical protein
MGIRNPDDLLSYTLPGTEAERETIEASNPGLVQNRAESFKALLRKSSSPA